MGGPEQTDAGSVHVWQGEKIRARACRCMHVYACQIVSGQTDACVCVCMYMSVYVYACQMVSEQTDAGCVDV